MIKLAYVKEKNGFDSKDIHLKKMTHIAYSFAKVIDTIGTVEFKMLFEDELIKFKQENPNIKVVMAVGGWGAGNFSESVFTEGNRINLVTNLKKLLDKYNFDGIDLDWEYPCFSDGQISSNSLDRINFTKFVELLRKEIGGDKSISFACGGLHKMVDSYEFDKLYTLTDFMNLMSYDMGGSFNSTGHQTNLFYSEKTGQYGAADYVDYFDKLGYKKDKINIGCAFYGRGATGLSNLNDGFLCEYISGEEGLYFDYHDIKALIDSGECQVLFDEAASAVYLKHNDTFITYDNVLTIENKLKYVEKNKLAGIMFWEHETDKTRDLIEVIINYKENYEHR